MYTYIAYNVNIRKYIHKTIFAQKRKCVLHTKMSTNNINMASQKHLGTFFPILFYACR